LLISLSYAERKITNGGGVEALFIITFGGGE